MEQIIQHLVFEDAQSDFAWELFRRGDRSVVTENNEGSHLLIGACCKVDFSSYFNSVSLGKWKLYTDIQNISVNLDIQGEFDLKLCSLSLNNGIPTRTLLKESHYNTGTRTQITEEFPECKDSLVYFELCTYSTVELYSGNYSAKFLREEPNQVELAIATTTCWKEDYIKPNIALLHKNLLIDNEVMRDHLTIHIVDNGRTLEESDFPNHARIQLHPNPNVGGSGGFARGMLEAKRQTPTATHVLLMDDDVKVIADSLYRTFVLLQTRKEEYQNHFIGGAMLILEDLITQHEDIGTIHEEFLFRPLKRPYNQRNLWDILDNELSIEEMNQYQAWWYCCIPMQEIEKIGLPMPFFIRCDDSEYSLRKKSKIMSMNGIAVWHMGFYGKYNPTMDIYQAVRNLFISNATSNFVNKDVILNRVKWDYRLNMYKHNYDAAEIAVRAMEDFMKGPQFLMEVNGEQLLKDNRKFNPKMIPMKELESLGYTKCDPYWDYHRPTWKRPLAKFLYRITYNGNRYWPSFLLKKEIMPIPFDWGYTPNKMTFRKTMIGVNPANKTGCIYKVDKQRFRKLHRRYIAIIKDFSKNYDAIAQEYKNKQQYMISDEFWWDYLKRNGGSY